MDYEYCFGHVTGQEAYYIFLVRKVTLHVSMCSQPVKVKGQERRR